MNEPAAPRAETLLVLDASIDRLASGQGGEPADLLAVARRLAALPDTVWDEVAPLFPPAESLGRRWWRGVTAHHGRPLLAVAAAVVLIAILLGVGLSGGGQAPPSRSAAGGWRLAGYVDQAAWTSTAMAGVLGLPVVLSCPVATTCYADEPGSSAASALVEVTTDGGSAWTALDLPAGLLATSGITCSSTGTCAVAATAPSGDGQVLFVHVGSGTWSSSPLPAGTLTITTVSCSTSRDCVVLGPGTPAAGAGRSPVALRTTDGGTTWVPAAMPAPFLPEHNGLSCADASHCVAVGVESGTPSVGAIRYSDDGGATWSPATVPPGIELVQAVSCRLGTRCVAVADGPATSGASPHGPSQALISTDGGRTWTVAATVLEGFTTLAALACPATSDCWAAGYRHSASGGVSGVIAATTDGGASWSSAALPPVPAPGSGLGSLDVEYVAAVSCPPSGSCVALGLAGSLAAGGQPVALGLAG